MGLVDDPIEYGVGEGRLADDIVPGVDGQLTGQKDRTVAVTVLDDLHEVASLRASKPVGVPVVEDQQVGADELPEQARKAAIAMREFELGEEAGQTAIKDGPAVATGLLSQSAGEPCLAHTAQANDRPPAFRDLRFGCVIRFILGRERWCRWSRDRVVGEPCI